MLRSILKLFFLALLSSTGAAFVVSPRAATSTALKAADPSDDESKPIFSPELKAAAFTTVVTLSQPMMALAEVDDYEYGAVSAPPFVPIIGGLLAILTALLPIALRGGEEAFEEMKATDGFGEGRDVLKSRKR